MTFTMSVPPSPTADHPAPSSPPPSSALPPPPPPILQPPPLQVLLDSQAPPPPQASTTSRLFNPRTVFQSPAYEPDPSSSSTRILSAFPSSSSSSHAHAHLNQQTNYPAHDLNGVYRGYDPTFSNSPFFYDRAKAERIEPEQARLQDHSNRVVSYFHPKDVGLYHFGRLHPMKAYRLTLTNELVLGYGLQKHMQVHSPRRATKEEIAKFHSNDYVEYLAKVTPASLAADIAYNNQVTAAAANKEPSTPGLAALRTTSSFSLPGSDIVNPDFLDDNPEGHINTHRIGSDDCPAFTGLFSFCEQYAGASLAAARKLCIGTTDIAMNWSGGLHHAKKGEASGFCYVNDIVLAILELLRVHPRVLYIDIDIHHGDGVQEAFYRSNRVLTVSFHKYAEYFFPGTGAISETGLNEGKYFSLNVPLSDGIDDDSYVSLFKSVIEPTITTFRPSAVVLQCGADSLGSDRLGTFNLSIKAHGECVRFIKSFHLPLLCVGGGGYRQSSVSRCWTYETSVLAGVEVSSQLPSTRYDAYFEGMSLHPDLRNRDIENANTPKSIEDIRRKIREQLRVLNGAPSVQMMEIPPSLTGLDEDDDLDEDEEDEDEMGTGSAGDVRYIIRKR